MLELPLLRLSCKPVPALHRHVLPELRRIEPFHLQGVPVWILLRSNIRQLRFQHDPDVHLQTGNLPGSSQQTVLALHVRLPKLSLPHHSVQELLFAVSQQLQLPANPQRWSVHKQEMQRWLLLQIRGRLSGLSQLVSEMVKLQFHKLLKHKKIKSKTSIIIKMFHSIQKPKIIYFSPNVL